MNQKSEQLDKLLDKYPDLNGLFIGFKYDRGGMGVSRLDNDWFECDEYYILADCIIKFLEDQDTMKSQKCKWIRAFDQHFNISCESGERANGNSKSCDDMSAKWEFVFCPYCGNEIEVIYEESKQDQ